MVTAQPRHQLGEHLLLPTPQGRVLHQEHQEVPKHPEKHQPKLLNELKEPQGVYGWKGREVLKGQS